MSPSDRNSRSEFPLVSQTDSQRSRPSPEGRLFRALPGGFYGWLRGPLRPGLVDDGRQEFERHPPLKLVCRFSVGSVQPHRLWR